MADALFATASRAPGANIWFAFEAAAGSCALKKLDDMQTFLVASTLPTYASQASVPLTVVASPNPSVPQSLVPLQIDQGFTCWYWVKAQTDDNSAAAVVLLQQFWTGGATSGVWVVYGGVFSASTARWDTLPTVFVNSSWINVTANGVIIGPGHPEVNGYIRITAGANATFEVMLAYANGAQVNLATGTSARGPTFEQAGSNVATTGPFQSGYWSIVDGRAQCALASTAAAAAQAAKPGWVWLDNQQFGLQRLPKLLQAVEALSLQAPVPSNALQWLWLTVQGNGNAAASLPAVQFNVFVAGKDALAQFSAGRAVVVTTGNVWLDGSPDIRHGITATVRQVATYLPDASSSNNNARYSSRLVPRQVLIVLDGTLWTLTSMCTAGNAPDMWQPLPHPAYNPLMAFESPCVATQQAIPDQFSIDTTPWPLPAAVGAAPTLRTGAGVIEWQRQQADAKATCAAIADENPGYSKAYNTSLAAILTVAAICGVVAVVIAVGVGFGVARKRQRARQ